MNDLNQTTLDKTKLKETINAELNHIQGQLDTLKLQVEIDPKALSGLTKQLDAILSESFKAAAGRLGSSLPSAGSKDPLSGLTARAQELKEEASALSQVHEIRLLSNGGVRNDYSTQIAKLEGGFRSLGFTEDMVSQKTAGILAAFDSLKERVGQPFDQNSYQEILSLNDTLKRELDMSANEYDKLCAHAEGVAPVRQRLAEANAIEAWNRENSAASKEVLGANEAYIASLRDLNSQMSIMQFDEISEGFKKSEASMRGMHKLVASFKNQMSQAAQGLTQWLSLSSGLSSLVSKAKSALSQLRGMDTLLTGMGNSDARLSDADLEEVREDSFEAAGRYGKSPADYLAGVREASRAGYENAGEIAELSLAAQNAGDMTAELAIQMILATDKAYRMDGSVSELKKVLDGVNAITNNSAVHMTELAEGMSISGSTAASLGVDANETAAALGTMVAATGQGGPEAAAALKTILLHIRQVADEEEGIEAEGLARYEEACNALGVSLKETINGVASLKDPMEVLGELSAAYNKLGESDGRREGLLRSVGGGQPAAQLDALLSRWDMYETMLAQYDGGAGSMAAEAEKTAGSWEGAMNRLSNTWTDTIGNIVDSDGAAAVLNGLNGILSLINSITKALGSLGTIGALGGGLLGAKGLG